MKKTTERFLAFLQNNLKEDGMDEGALRSGVRDVITDILHVCDEEGFDVDLIIESAREVFNEEKEE